MSKTLTVEIPSPVATLTGDGVRVDLPRLPHCQQIVTATAAQDITAAHYKLTFTDNVEMILTLSTGAWTSSADCTVDKFTPRFEGVAFESLAKVRGVEIVAYGTSDSDEGDIDAAGAQITVGLDTSLSSSIFLYGDPRKPTKISQHAWMGASGAATQTELAIEVATLPAGSVATVEVILYADHS